MKFLTVLTLFVLFATCPAFSQETSLTLRAENQISFALLKEKAEGYVNKMEAKIQQIEINIAKSQGKIARLRKEIAEQEDQLVEMNSRLEFLDLRIKEHDSLIMRVGTRVYPKQTIDSAIEARREETSELSENITEKLKEIEFRKKSIEKQKIMLLRVKTKMKKARKIMKDQAVRNDCVSDQMNALELVLETGPKAELLFASETDIGRMLGEIETQISTLEAFYEIKSKDTDLNLMNLEKTPYCRRKEKKNE